MKISTLPGLNGSGPNHWQTLWEKKYGFTRVEQAHWDIPIYAEWEENLIRYIETNPDEKEHVFIAHSLGSILIANALEKIRDYAKAIFLVATPDPNGNEFSKFLKTFQNIPDKNLNLFGYFIYSEDDSYSTPDFSEKCSKLWGLKSVNIGKKGHINTDSGIDDWNEGYQLFKQFISEI